MCLGGVGDFLEDAVDFTKSSIGALGSRFGDSLVPGFDPIIGNPLKGDFMDGDAVITPTGNFSNDVWQDMYDKAGDDHGYLDRFYNYNQVADKVAPAIAGGYAANGLSNIYTAGGGEAVGSGAGTISGEGTSLAGSGTALGSTEGLSTTGAGWGSVGGGAVSAAPGVGLGHDALGSTEGMSPINPVSPSAVQGNNMNFLDSLQSIFNYGNDLYNSPVGKTAQGLGKIFGAYQDYQGQRAAQRAAQNNLTSLNTLYSPNSPYAKQMAQTLARRDAAAGRNSQYGPRAQALAANLTQNQAAIQSSPTYLASLGIANNTAAPWSDIGSALSGFGNLYSGLRGLF